MYEAALLGTSLGTCRIITIIQDDPTLEVIVADSFNVMLMYSKLVIWMEGADWGEASLGVCSRPLYNFKLADKGVANSELFEIRIPHFSNLI